MGTITANKSAIYVHRDESVAYIEVTYDDATPLGSEFEGDFIDAVDEIDREEPLQSIIIVTYEISLNPNYELEERKSGYINFMAYNAEELEVPMYQMPSDYYVMPIWKDIPYTFSGETSGRYKYTLKKGNTEIYSGLATSGTTGNNAKIYVNRLVDSYLKSGKFDGLNWIYQTDAIGTFNLYDGNNNLLCEYRFIYDWSYNIDLEYFADSILNRPINGKGREGMSVYYSVFYDLTQGTPSTYKINNTTLPTLTNSVGTYHYSIGNTNATFYQNGATKFTYTCDGCGDWACYYLNKYGGIDSFLFEGGARKTDNIERQTYVLNYNNTDAFAYGESDLIGSISTTIALTTGWLTNEQSKNFAFNLLGSGKVMIENLNDGEIYSAVIADTTVEYQTFRGNDRRMAQYTVTFKLSQNRKSR